MTLIILNTKKNPITKLCFNNRVQTYLKKRVRIQDICGIQENEVQSLKKGESLCILKRQNWEIRQHGSVNHKLLIIR